MWLDEQQPQLHHDAWCALVSGTALRLAERGLHAQAEDLLRRALGHCPDHLPIHQQLAELAMLQGRTPQAMSLLRRAIVVARKAQQPSVALRLRLAGMATPTDAALAQQVVQQALDELNGLRPGVDAEAGQIRDWQAQVQVALAAVQAQQQQFAQAEASYRQALQDQPQMLSALQGLGQLQMQLGRIDEAVALFEQVKALDPARGYSALINARRLPEDEATLQRLEALARRPSAEGPVQPGPLLQLATAWEQRQDHAKAFALADESNAASRALLSYDPAAHRQYCARIRHAFSRTLYDHRPGLGASSTLPVFVLGMPRSGTTLVEQILAGHSQIHGAGELGQIPGVIAGLERWERRAGSGRHYPDCVDDLSVEVSKGISANMLKELQDYAPEARHVIDKLPHNFENIGLIKLLFPRARIISVRRDPRDIAISNYFPDYAATPGGMGSAYERGWSGEQPADHNLLMQHWQQLFPGEILEVNYEDVVADAEGQARRMLDYIGVGWEPQVLNFSELERPVKTASVWQVRQPIYATSKARWERYREHLAPLIRSTNAKIEWQPITDMVTLPEPGLLDSGVALYREERLDEAEYRFQQLLHHLPEHAAANFMVGLIYVRKGHLADGIALMEQGLMRCPWNKNWRSDLLRACDLAGDAQRAAHWRQPAREEKDA
ncbi:sulfotransferase [Paucibacter sp. XJ19-41]|uniref:sulfotransferase n=1 Tax=Paucibacter sp. XJ19-41 TaxID=2927824 RepID=UPI00300DF73E